MAKRISPEEFSDTKGGIGRARKSDAIGEWVLITRVASFLPLCDSLVHVLRVILAVYI